jgi:predicted metal-binding membrane protein
MSQAVLVAGTRWISLRERLAWRHPEWWSLALSAISWMLLLTRTTRPHHAAHAIGGLSEWALMVVAMMFPMVIVPVRVTAERSLWRRRHRAIAEFLAGYVLVWLVVGAIGIWVLTTLPLVSWVGLPLSTSLGLLVAAVWQLGPAKRRALRACHRTAPLAGHGWRADRDCVAYGLTSGGRCVLNCWAMMFACLLSAHNIPVMVGATMVGLGERYAMLNVKWRILKLKNSPFTSAFSLHHFRLR